MKDFDDIFKQRLEGYEMKLPDTDRDAFLNRQATRSVLHVDAAHI